MSRSVKKGPYVHPKLMKKVEALQRSGAKTVIRTWSRASMIMPEMVGMTIGVHDGRRHVPPFADLHLHDAPARSDAGTVYGIAIGVSCPPNSCPLSLLAKRASSLLVGRLNKLNRRPNIFHGA